MLNTIIFFSFFILIIVCLLFLLKTKNNGKLFVVTGHSGAGKTSIMRQLLGTNREIVSLTTRKMRDGEIDGVDYYFISQEEFDELDRNNELAEKTTYYGRASYGVTKSEINRKLSKGNAYIIVDYNGMKQLKKIYPNLVSIFIFTDRDTAVSRMMGRGETRDFIEARLTTYETEINNMKDYDYAIKNSLLRNTLDVINFIVKCTI